MHSSLLQATVESGIFKQFHTDVILQNNLFSNHFLRQLSVVLHFIYTSFLRRPTLCLFEYIGLV